VWTLGDVVEPVMTELKRLTSGVESASSAEDDSSFTLKSIDEQDDEAVIS